MRPAFALLRLLAFAALAACNARPNAGPPDRLENTWRLVELAGHPVISPDGERGAHLRFVRDSARVVGSTGCNRLSGPFTREGATLRFGPAMVTRMACLDPQRNEQEERFLEVLRATERHEIAGDTLTLIGSAGPLARLIARAQ